MNQILEADQKERQSIKPDNSNVDAEFPNKMRNYAITALFATVAMVAFAISAGIIELSIEVINLLKFSNISSEIL